MTPPRENFGQVLRRLRSEAGMSQERLAAVSDLDRTYISMLERGLRQPSLDTLVRLADALETDLVGLSRRIQEGFDEDH